MPCFLVKFIAMIAAMIAGPLDAEAVDLDA